MSLAENVECTPLRPLDQFRTFQVMCEKGVTKKEITAAFFVGATVVKQRLCVAPTAITRPANSGPETMWKRVCGPWREG